MAEDLPPQLQRRIVEMLKGRLAAEFRGEVIESDNFTKCVIEILVDDDHAALVKKVDAAVRADVPVRHAVWQGFYPRTGSSVLILDIELQGNFEIPLTLQVDSDTPRDWAITLGAADGLILRFVDVGVDIAEPPTLTTLDVPIKPRQEGTTLSDVDYWLRGLITGA